MTDVRQSPPVGQEATPDPAAEARNLLEALRNLAFDAVSQKRERHHTKQHLRRSFKAHFRALEVRINVLAAGAAKLAASPEPATPPAS